MASDNKRSSASTVTDYSTTGHTVEPPLHLAGSDLLEQSITGRTAMTPEGSNHILHFAHNALLGQAISDADEAPPPWDNLGHGDTSEDDSGSDDASAPSEIMGTIGSIYVALRSSSVPAPLSFPGVRPERASVCVSTPGGEADPDHVIVSRWDATTWGGLERGTFHPWLNGQWGSRVQCGLLNRRFRCKTGALGKESSGGSLFYA